MPSLIPTNKLSASKNFLLSLLNNLENKPVQCKANSIPSPNELIVNSEHSVNKNGSVWECSVCFSKCKCKEWSEKNKDSEDLEYVDVFVSSDLNEYKIADFVDAGCPMDGYGVGTEMITAKPV